MKTEQLGELSNARHFKYLTLQTLDIANTRRCNHSIRALMVGTTANSESSCCCVWEWGERNLPTIIKVGLFVGWSNRLPISAFRLSQWMSVCGGCVSCLSICLSHDYSHTLLPMIMKSGINVLVTKTERIFYFPRLWKCRSICDSLSQMGVKWGLQFTEILVIILYLNWLHNEPEI